MKQYTPTAKAFSWSYSKLKNYRTCPMRYYKIDVEKKYQEDFSGEHLLWGKQVHTAFEERVRDGKPFPKGMEHFEEHAAPLVAFPGHKLVEHKMAIRRDFSPCGYFDKDVWYRAQADFLGINGRVALGIDYKTGKVLEESEQLALIAECIFSHFPEVDAVRTEFWWLKEEAATKENFYRSKRKETWRGVLPKVLELEAAHSRMEFPPIQSGLCKKYCIVKECKFNGGNS